MKKSELKSALSELKLENKLSSGEVDAIIDLIESLGIEPPKIKRKVTLEKKIDPNHIYSYVEYVNEWETEDETK